LANFISFADIPASEALFKMLASAKLAAANFFLCSNCSANLKFFVNNFNKKITYLLIII
jgi:hypothetical protein